jgi:hypothetical protein
MRALSLIGVLLAAGLSGCTFDAQKPDIIVNVTGISQDTTQNVDHLEVTVTLADGDHPYRPTFQPQATTSVELSFSSGGQAGTYKVVISEADRNGTLYATKTLGPKPLPQAAPDNIDLSAP